MQKIILTRGLPGSGKTTWAKKYCEKNLDYIRVSRDDLRNMRGRYWIPKQEGLITAMVEACVLEALMDNKHVILDATNFGERTSVHMAAIINNYKALTDKEAKIEIKDFTHIPVEECIKNDLKRPNSVGQKVIMDFYTRHLAEKVEPAAWDENLPTCLIIDIDGTVAQRQATDKRGMRSPYDWARVGEDKKDDVVAGIVSDYKALYPKIEFIFMSGRDSVCKPQTEQWLKDNNIQYDQLHMRVVGDERKDTIVKQELYEAHIKGKYNVLFVLDDRNGVVKMWREQGLKCLQVEEGNF